MASFFKYLGAFCLLTIAASLAFCSMGIYNGLQTVNRVLAGADNYTCRQFQYDISHSQTDKLPALAIATIAYGSGTAGEGAKTEKDLSNEIVEKGMSVSVLKVVKLCEGKPDSRVLNLFTEDATGQPLATVSQTPPAAAISATSVSTSTPQTAQ